MKPTLHYIVFYEVESQVEVYEYKDVTRLIISKTEDLLAALSLVSVVVSWSNKKQ